MQTRNAADPKVISIQALLASPQAQQAENKPLVTSLRAQNLRNHSGDRDFLEHSEIEAVGPKAWELIIAVQDGPQQPQQPVPVEKKSSSPWQWCQSMWLTHKSERLTNKLNDVLAALEDAQETADYAWSRFRGARDAYFNHDRYMASPGRIKLNRGGLRVGANSWRSEAETADSTVVRLSATRSQLRAELDKVLQKLADLKSV